MKKKNIIFIIFIIIFIIIILIFLFLIFYNNDNVNENIVKRNIACPFYVEYNNSIIPLNNDINYKEIKNITPNNCQEECNKNFCNWFSYNNDNNCWIFYGKPMNNINSTIKNVNSINNCPNYFTNKNLYIPGNVISTNNNLIESECNNLCLNNKNCIWSVYDKINKKCYQNSLTNKDNYTTKLKIV